MKSAAAKIAVPNSLLYIRDPTLHDRLEIEREGALWFLPSVIAVGCLHNSEGDTAITIGPASDVGRADHLLFDGKLETPSRRLVVEIVPWTKVLEVEVPDGESNLKIWTDGHRDADTVIIGVG